MIFDVIGFGALNLDRLYQVDRIAGSDEESHINEVLESCGGSAANTITGLSRLGLKTGLLGKLADDEAGTHILNNLKKENINTDGLLITPKGRSGIVHGFVDNDGERALYVDPGVNDKIQIDELDKIYAQKCKILHLTSFVGSSMHAQEALIEELPSKVMVSMDPGMIYARKGLESLEKLLNQTNILLLNQIELNILFPEGNLDDKIRNVLQYGIKILVVKSGESGCQVTDGSSLHTLKAFKTSCQDTTGAGDAFNAGFLYGILKKENLKRCGIMGNYVASRCVEKNGAREGLPLIDNLVEIIKND
jgi:ribokinase